MQPEPDAVDAAAPFEPQPANLSGCGKPAVIGCLVILVVVAVGFIFFLVKARNLLHWALAQYEQTVVSNLAEEVTPEERARLEAAFDRALAAIDENRMQPDALRGLQRFMAAPPSPDRPVDAETVRELTEALEAMAVSSPAVPEPEAPDVAPPAMEPVTDATALLIPAPNASLSG